LAQRTTFRIDFISPALGDSAPKRYKQYVPLGRAIGLRSPASCRWSSASCGSRSFAPWRRWS